MMKTLFKENQISKTTLQIVVTKLDAITTTNVKRLFVKCYVFIIISMTLCSCNSELPSNLPSINESSIDSKNVSPTLPTIVVAVVDDRTGSFKNEAEIIQEENLRSLFNFFKEKEKSQSILISFIKDSSNKLLIRYTDVQPMIIPEATKKDNNSWEDHKGTPYNQALMHNKIVDSINLSNWNKFINEINTTTTKILYSYSDIEQAFKRVLIGLSENKDAKKYLIIQTDFKDTHNKAIYNPQIPDDVEVIVVGSIKTIPKSIKKYVGVETFTSAIQYIIK